MVSRRELGARRGLVLPPPIGELLMPQRNPSRAEDAVLDCTVHIVDDDASFRTALERRLTKAGYNVATYAGGQHLLNDLSERAWLHHYGCTNTRHEWTGIAVPVS